MSDEVSEALRRRRENPQAHPPGCDCDACLIYYAVMGVQTTDPTSEDWKDNDIGPFSVEQINHKRLELGYSLLPMTPGKPAEQPVIPESHEDNNSSMPERPDRYEESKALDFDESQVYIEKVLPIIKQLVEVLSHTKMDYMIAITVMRESENDGVGYKMASAGSIGPSGSDELIMMAMIVEKQWDALMFKLLSKLHPDS